MLGVFSFNRSGKSVATMQNSARSFIGYCTVLVILYDFYVETNLFECKMYFVMYLTCKDHTSVTLGSVDF